MLKEPPNERWVGFLSNSSLPNALLILFPRVLSHDMNRDENYPFPVGIGLSSDFRLRSWYSPSLILYLTHSCMEFGAADIK